MFGFNFVSFFFQCLTCYGFSIVSLKDFIISKIPASVYTIYSQNTQIPGISAIAPAYLSRPPSPDHECYGCCGRVGTIILHILITGNFFLNFHFKMFKNRNFLNPSVFFYFFTNKDDLVFIILIYTNLNNRTFFVSECSQGGTPVVSITPVGLEWLQNLVRDTMTEDSCGKYFC